MSEKKVMWLCGKPSAGKTFTGDYLQTRGWHHIDGDSGNQSEDAAVRESMMKLWEGMQLAAAGTACTEDYWKPYYSYLVKQIKAGVEQHDKVVISFAIMGLFDGEEAFLRESFPNIIFVSIIVDSEVLLQRILARNKKFFEAMGTTQEQMWYHESNAHARKQFGEEYSDEIYDKFIRKTFLGEGMIKIPNDKDKNCYQVEGTDLENDQAIKAICEIVGLDYTPVDKAAVDAVNMERMKRVKMDEFAAIADQMEQRLSKDIWLGGQQPSKEDAEEFEKMTEAPSAAKLPNKFAWWSLCSRFTEAVRKQWPAAKPAAAKGAKEGKKQDSKKGAKKEEKKEEIKPADDDEDDLFGDDEEDEEAEKAKMARMKEIAKTAKSYGKKVVAKSLIIFEVKPWGEETDLDEMGKKILAIDMDGCWWKTEYKKEPIAYGVFKLVIGATIEDERCSTDALQEKIEELEDLVQSVDIAAFNKL